MLAAGGTFAGEGAWNNFTWPLHMEWTSSQCGRKVPKASMEREMRGEVRGERGSGGEGRGGEKGRGEGKGGEEHVLQGDTTLPFLIQPQSSCTITSIAFHSPK